MGNYWSSEPVREEKTVTVEKKGEPIYLHCVVAKLGRYQTVLGKYHTHANAENVIEFCKEFLRTKITGLLELIEFSINQQFVCYDSSIHCDSDEGYYAMRQNAINPFEPQMDKAKIIYDICELYGKYQFDDMT